MASEPQEVKKLFLELCRQPKRHFPQVRRPLDAPTKHGVYMIAKGDTVVHVGRTYRRANGLQGRLKNHLNGSSSFTDKFLNGNGSVLRNGYIYQLLEVEDDRLRALVEAYATGRLCPKHLGLGRSRA
jgi:hypothetical protein